MNAAEYEKIMAAIIPLDTPTLARLETDVARLLKNRKTPEPSRPTMKEILAMAQESLRGIDKEKYWAEREAELADSKNSWAEKEKELDMIRGGIFRGDQDR